MKIKLDENLGRRCAALLHEAGHDVSTVFEQRLTGAQDVELIRVCALEKRCLLTLDLDFSNPLNFPPADYSGIAVIRLPDGQHYDDLMTAVETFISALTTNEIDGGLWIVEHHRIRIYRLEEDER